MIKLFEIIMDIIDDALDDDVDMPILERIIGIAMMFILTAIGLVCGAILLCTSPIWGIPYVIWKKNRRNEQNDE